MMEFIKSCYQWLIENHDKIIMTLTSAQFVSLVSALVLLVKSIRRTTDNVTASNKLNATLENTNSMSETVKSLKEELLYVKQENKALKSQLTVNQTEIVNYLDSQSLRLKAMLEVQSIVYSTIKDDNIRNTVNSILINAKYAESTSRAKLQQEVEELKQKVAEKMNEVSEQVDKTVDVVKGIVNVEDTPHSEQESSKDMMRY